MCQRKSYEYSCPWAFWSKLYTVLQWNKDLGQLFSLSRSYDKLVLNSPSSDIPNSHMSQPWPCSVPELVFFGVNPSHFYESIVSGCDGTPESWSEAWTNERSMEPSLNHEAFKHLLVNSLTVCRVDLFWLFCILLNSGIDFFSRFCENMIHEGNIPFLLFKCVVW